MNSVEKINERDFVICVKKPPREGKANEGVIAVLAEYFGVSKLSVRIVSGFSSRRKIIEILA